MKIWILFLYISPFIWGKPQTCRSLDSKEKELCEKNDKETYNIPIPLFQGRCCSSDENIKYWCTEPLEAILEGFNCNTKWEKCTSITPKTKKPEACYFNQIEHPYRCCYIGNGKINYCMPINVSKKKFFNEYLSYIRMMNDSYNSYQGDFEIECGGNFIKTIPILILLSFLFFI